MTRSGKPTEEAYHFPGARFVNGLHRMCWQVGYGLEQNKGAILPWSKGENNTNVRQLITELHHVVYPCIIYLAIKE